MMKWSLLLIASVTAGGAPAIRAPLQRVGLDTTIRVTLLHLNDVYEIAPLEQGRHGGLARVATIRRQLLAANPHTYTVLSGDLFSPSALGTAPYDGGQLNGRQMVSVLNTMGLDVATFGNHEFDLARAAFEDRLRESRFQWVSSNVRDSLGTPFDGVATHLILRVTDRRWGAQTLRIGMVGVTITSNRARYVRYLDPITAARTEARAIRDSVDILIALTHLSLPEDRELVEAAPEVDLVLGGHEHENWQVWRGPNLTPILKADANARTVDVVELAMNPRTHRPRISSRLVSITDSIAEDSATAQVVSCWLGVAYAGFRAAGFEPTAVVAEIPAQLDGRESVVRQDSTALTGLIGEALLREAPGSAVSIYNSGSIRIDDVVPPGPVSQYDVMRILPFGGKVLSLEMRGRLLRRVLDRGLQNRGAGGYLQVRGAARDSFGTWTVRGQPITDDRWYPLAINDYLVSGRASELDSLNRANADIRGLRELRDIRAAVIDELRRTYP